MTSRNMKRAKRVARRLGNLRDVRWDAQSGKATFYVGLKPGKEPQHRGRCGRRAIKVTTVDAALLKTRSVQVGKGQTGATRFHSTGWYEGGKEPAAVYELSDIGVDGDWSGFRRNMSALAEKLARKFCQDEVIVTFTEPGGRETHTCSYGAGPGDGTGYCKP